MAGAAGGDRLAEGSSPFTESGLLSFYPLLGSFCAPNNRPLQAAVIPSFPALCIRSLHCSCTGMGCGRYRRVHMHVKSLRHSKCSFGT